MMAPIGGVVYSEVLHMVCKGRLKMSFRRPLVWLEEVLKAAHGCQVCVICWCANVRRCQIPTSKTPPDPILPAAQAGAVFRYIAP